MDNMREYRNIARDQKNVNDNNNKNKNHLISNRHWIPNSTECEFMWLSALYTFRKRSGDIVSCSFGLGS